jgi:hypothetical protein
MIISASRRTDIPAFFGDWFINRIKEKYVIVINPFNTHQASKINLSPSEVDCIVFWTKDPKPFIKQLPFLDDLGYKYYFQFTINPYSREQESGVPLKSEVIDTFHELSNMIGPERVIWRYDPIFISEKIGIDYHKKYFEYIAKSLSSYTKECVISFLDVYNTISKRINDSGIFPPDISQMHILAKAIKDISSKYNILPKSCCEQIDLKEDGINHGKCIDDLLIRTLINKNIIFKKDKTQRESCGCVQSIDIGAYNTCNHNCAYCYATFSEQKKLYNLSKYSPESPTLCSNIDSDIIIFDRINKNNDKNQELEF